MNERAWTTLRRDCVLISPASSFCSSSTARLRCGIAAHLGEEFVGFIAALDQSGGSTPGALRLYGIADNAYSGDAEMFRLVHEMRVRIMTAPAFTGAKVIATILFEGTMDGEVKGKSAPAFLWEERGVIPFVKVDKGLEAEKDGVQLMRPMPELDALLTRAVKLGVFGTKMRSVINLASKDGIAAVVAQQFDVAATDR